MLPLASVGANRPILAALHNLRKVTRACRAWICGILAAGAYYFTVDAAHGFFARRFIELRQQILGLGVRVCERRGSVRALLALFLLVGAAAGGFALFLDHKKPAQRVSSAFKGDWQLIDFKDRKPFSLASLRGKVIVMNLWATWCPPCVQEMPTFQRLYDRFKDNPNVAFVFVSLDGSPDPVEGYLRKTQFTMPIYLRAEEPPIVFRPDDGIPRTFFIAKDGRIVKADSGFAEWDKPWVIQELEQLAAE